MSPSCDVNAIFATCDVGHFPHDSTQPQSLLLMNGAEFADTRTTPVVIAARWTLARDLNDEGAPQPASAASVRLGRSEQMSVGCPIQTTRTCRLSSYEPLDTSGELREGTARSTKGSVFHATVSIAVLRYHPYLADHERAGH